MIFSTLLKYFRFYLLMVTSFASAKESFNIPDDFSSFFETTERDVSFHLGNERDAILLRAEVSYQGMLITKPSEKVKLIDFLNKNNIHEQVIREVLESVEVGIENDRECNVRIERCVLVAGDRSNQRYAYDYQSLQVKLFLHVDAFALEEASTYYSAYSEHNAVINYTNLSAYTDFNGGNNVNWRNETTFGLPYGYGFLDSQFYSNRSKLDVNQAFYELNLAGADLRFGKEKYLSERNATDYMLSGSNGSSTFVSFYSNSKLEKNATLNSQALELYSPTTAQLEIVRGDQILISRNVMPGQFLVPYDDLPKGVYDIEISIKNSDDLLYYDIRQVVNSSVYDMAVGDFDYALSAGVYYSQVEGTNPSSTKKEKGYVQSLIASRVKEGLILGAGVNISQLSQYYMAGFQYAVSDISDLRLNGGYFSDGDYYLTGRFSYGAVSIDLRALELIDNQNHRLVYDMYGANNFKEFTAGVGGALPFTTQTSGYFRYSYFDNKSIDYDQESNVSHSLSGGVSIRDFFGGTLSVDTNYFSHRTLETDELRFDISWSRPFSADIRTRTSLSTVSNGQSRYSQSLSKEFKGNNWSSHVSAGTFYNQDELSSELTINSYVDNGVMASNLFAHLQTDDSYMLSGSISGTQYFSADSIGAISEKANAVGFFAPYTHEIPEEHEFQLNVTRVDKRNSRMMAHSGQAFRLDSYHFLNVELETELQKLALDDGYEISNFIHPGSLHLLRPKVRQLKSAVVLSSSADIDIYCAEGCDSFEKLTNDGVYRINYDELNKVELKTFNNTRCSLDEHSTSKALRATC